MRRRKSNWRESRSLCIDSCIGSKNQLDRLYEIIKRVEKQTPEANSKDVYIRACEYKD